MLKNNSLLAAGCRGPVPGGKTDRPGTKANAPAPPFTLMRARPLVITSSFKKIVFLLMDPNIIFSKYHARTIV
jgi:hypothetical protein